MTNKKTPNVKKETLSVKTFKAKKNTTYLQCDNAYDPERPYCHNTIKDGEEYLMAIYKFDDGCIMQYDYCEGCMREKFSEEKIEKARGAKKSQTKGARIQTIVDDIRRRLKTYNGSDPTGLAAMETALDKIVAITNERT